MMAIKSERNICMVENEQDRRTLVDLFVWDQLYRAIHWCWLELEGQPATHGRNGMRTKVYVKCGNNSGCSASSLTFTSSLGVAVWLGELFLSDCCSTIIIIVIITIIGGLYLSIRMCDGDNNVTRARRGARFETGKGVPQDRRRCRGGEG